MTTEKKYQIICPSCQTRYRASNKLIGISVTCKNCGAGFQISKFELFKNYSSDTGENKNAAVVKAQKEGGLEFFVSERGMKATVRIKRPIEPIIAKRQIKDFLLKKAIIYGILDDIEINRFFEKKLPESQIFEIAKGKPPEQGKDASIKYYFDKNPRKIGVVNSGGNIDFKDRGEVPYVKSGDLLAEKVPILKGNPGIDIYGNSVEPKEIKDIKLRCGTGTQLSEDGLKVFALVHGQPKISFNDKISVLTEYKIEGDIGLETGHINFDGNVDVKGTIQNGFRVKGFNIWAMEIGAAEIDAAGDIDVSGGIIGANIKAQGRIRAKFIKGAKISAYGNIIVEKEIVDSEINTSGACRVLKGKIISSVMAAKKGVTAIDIGSEVSNPCQLNVGVEEHIEKEINGIKDEILIRKNKLEKLQTMVSVSETRQQDIHKEITALAQVQDRAMVSRRTLENEMKALQEQGEGETFAQAENELKELAATAKRADEAINKLFEKQDQLFNSGAEIQKKIKEIHEEMDELRSQRNAIVTWSRKEKRVPIVKTPGKIFGGTIISGVHSSMVLKKNYRNVLIKEVEINHPNIATRWEMRLRSID
ncbi:MAG: DUF342 domain-containing protein [Desulfobacterales bacterium]|nr:DUF342 domain-containing protein [Desulfobacterales bacterium]